MESLEELLIRKIESGTRGIKLGTKTPETAEVGKSLNKLKTLNEGMYIDLLNNYKAVLLTYNDKKNANK